MTKTEVGPVTGRKKAPFLVRLGRALWRLVSDRPYRHARLSWLRPKGAFQPFNTTFANRYPAIFDFVRSTLGADSDVRILSYGCSTGEEVFTLRGYFPCATIKGVDIDPGNIATCRRRLKQAPDAGISFEMAASTAAEPTASYDAIFCMAVFRHGALGHEGVTRCDHLIRFDDFAGTVADINRCLRPGGLLIIRHSNFRLSDTPAGRDFTTVLTVGRRGNAPKTPVFGPDNRLMPGVDYLDTVFRKNAAA